MILVTGGAGFIGCNFVRDWLAHEDEPVLNLDALTYAGNVDNLKGLEHEARHRFVQGDIADRVLLDNLLKRYQPRAIVHLAAESHVDRSIHQPESFIRTNIDGTFVLLEAARNYWDALPVARQEAFRFLHVSTDEVYGDLSSYGAPAAEGRPYRPNSPYSASKAAGDHLVRAWHHTYGLPTVTSHCSNNYGPHQFPEKLIPKLIVNALAGRNLPIYGDGRQVRDWLYVGDHCRALRYLLREGRPGETYNVGGNTEKTNLEVVHAVCGLLDVLRPDAGGSYLRLLQHVADRPGHDRRYAIDAGKIRHDVGWQPLETFDSGIGKTVRWYLANQKWVGRVQSGAYRRASQQE